MTSFRRALSLIGSSLSVGPIVAVASPLLRTGQGASSDHSDNSRDEGCGEREGNRDCRDKAREQRDSTSMATMTFPLPLRADAAHATWTNALLKLKDEGIVYIEDLISTKTQLELLEEIHEYRGGQTLRGKHSVKSLHNLPVSEPSRGRFHIDLTRLPRAELNRYLEIVAPLQQMRRFSSVLLNPLPRISGIYL
jgi:hypothetical protein